MQYWEAWEGARELRVRAEAFMDRHGIASTPTAGDSAAPAHSTAKPAIELQFQDSDTTIIVDAELHLNDARLIKLLRWWRALPKDGSAPAWHDSALQEIAFVREHVHLHEIEPAAQALLIRFVGDRVSQALGMDISGQRFDLSSSRGPDKLRTTLARTFEAANLTRHVGEPLRTYAKTFHRFPTGHFSDEGLWLPFRNGGREFVLGATIFTPLASESVA